MPNRHDGLAQESILNSRDKVRDVDCSSRKKRAATPHRDDKCNRFAKFFDSDKGHIFARLIMNFGSSVFTGKKKFYPQISQIFADF